MEKDIRLRMTPHVAPHAESIPASDQQADAGTFGVPLVKGPLDVQEGVQALQIHVDNDGRGLDIGHLSGSEMLELVLHELEQAESPLAENLGFQAGAAEDLGCNRGSWTPG
jgi:hypothetical protein